MNKKTLKRKVSITPDGCWLLGEFKSYAVIAVGGKYRNANKVYYEAFVGDVPKGKILTNSCRNRPCVSPKHWKPKTRAEVTRLGIMLRDAKDTRGEVARWMDRLGITTGDLAAIAKSSDKAAASWRQGGYPNEEFESNIRARYKSFPTRPFSEGTI